MFAWLRAFLFLHYNEKRIKEELKMKPTLNIAACVLVEGGKILATKRNLDRISGGYYEFPGGKIEPGETPKETIRREVKEELGDEIIIGQKIPTPTDFEYSYAYIHIHFYLAKLKTHNLKQIAAHDFIWDYPKNLENLNWLLAAQPVVKWLATRNLTKEEFNE